MDFDATLTAAFIAGAVSVVVTVLSKDQKTSEFRQAWIDELRRDVSLVSSQMGVIASVVMHKEARGEADARNGVIEMHEVFIEIEATLNRIKLRLNKDEHTAILEVIRSLGDEDAGHSMAAMKKLSEQLIEEARPILKSEWERVKRGERSFVFLKLTGLAGVVFAGAYFASPYLLWILSLIN